jgi:hypothetical protein
MNKFTVQMVGIMYFNVCSKNGENSCPPDAREVLIPDGTQGDGHIPPHLASLFIEKDLCVRDDWWTAGRIEHQVQAMDEQGQLVTKRVIEFQIPQGDKPATIEFPYRGNGTFEAVNLDRLLPRIGTIDPQFELDLEHPSAIARIPLRGGRLEAFALNGGAATVQWTFETDSEPLTITAQSETSSGTVTVKAVGGRLGTEIVLSNTPDLLSRVQLPTVVHTPGAHEHASADAVAEHAGHGEGGVSHGGNEDHHFKLYGKLEKHRNASRLNFPKDREDLPFGTHYLKAVSTVHLASGCTPTCCA